MPLNRFDTDADDYCQICWTENLAAAPSIELACGHVFHYSCVRELLQRRWNGRARPARVSLSRQHAQQPACYMRPAVGACG